MAFRAWVCETCNKPDNRHPWDCPGCGKEVCENCFDKYGTCKSCCEGKTDEQLKEQANVKGGFDFE